MALLKTSTGGQWVIPLMAGLRAHGHEVLVLVPDPAELLGRQLVEAHIPVERAPAPVGSLSPLRQAASLRALRRVVKAWKPDVVNYHLYSSALAGRVACLGLDAARVHMVPGPLYLEVPLIRCIERFLWRFDDHVICSSSHIYRAYLRLGVPCRSLSFVPYSVDFEKTQPASEGEKAAARRRLGLEEDGFVVVCVAWFYPPKRLVHRGKGIKGHEVLLRAWRRYRQKGGNGTLLLVGSGVGESGRLYRSALRHDTALNPDDSVLWLGHVDDVRACYAAADISVLPSWSENYGSLGEASASGVPTIASAVGGVPELVLAGATGWLFRAGDWITLASQLAEAEELKSEDRLVPIGRRARRLSSALVGRQTSVEDYRAIIEHVASQGRTRWPPTIGR